jgi:RNA polymerase primary sigma factor
VGRARARKDWLRRVQAANRAAADARNEFVKANLRLVVSIARRFNHGRMALADLIQEGNLGLMKAVERYDYRRGFRFSTYASWWIRHAISRALADKGREVRLPVHMIDAQHRLTKARRQLTGQLGRQPTTEELAAATEMPLDKVEKMRSWLLEQSVSIDKPVGDDEGRVLGEVLEDPDREEVSPTGELEWEALTSEVRDLLRELRPIEADILRQRFGLGTEQELTLKEIGDKYNLSRERIRQLQEQALAKMRRALARRDLL